MKQRLVVILLVALVFAAAGGAGGWWYANMQAQMREFDRQAAAPTPPGKKILYYHDPMVPQSKFDKPGKSPFMDMQLVPVYADDDGDAKGPKEGVKISAQASQSLGARTAEAKMTQLARAIEVVGNVAFDESAIEIVQARVTGWIEKLYARTPNDPVARGAPLAAIYAPEWLAAQEEYLAVRKPGNADLAAAARARLNYLGIPEANIAALERDGRADPRVTLTAPAAGVLLPLGTDMNAAMGAFAREGMQVSPGVTLFRIASLATVWVLADVPEAAIAAVRVGSAVTLRTPALAGKTLKGVVAALLPEVNPATRTVRARIRIANPDGVLKPGMFATLSITGEAARRALVVPSEAVIATGARKLVMLALADGRFAQRVIETGMEARVDGQDVTEITRGLSAGERVVVSGQFLFDSEASLKGLGAAAAPVVDATKSAAAGTPPPKGAEHRGEARVEKIAGDAVTLSHGPIASIKWPEMTMDFKAPKGGLPRNVARGDKVDFSFVEDKDGDYRITRIAPLAPPPARPEAKK